jgi:hypothetical protein
MQFIRDLIHKKRQGGFQLAKNIARLLEDERTLAVSSILASVPIVRFTDQRDSICLSSTDRKLKRGSS